MFNLQQPLNPVNMRKILLPLLFLLIACNSRQNVEKNENTDYPVSMDGIGHIKLDMSQQELEKLVNKKIPLTNPWDTISGSWQDSAFIWYKEADLKLTFQRTYIKTDSFYMRIIQIETSSPLCKTASGIGIGSGKQNIIEAFEDHLLIINPDFEDTTYTTRSKTRFTINVRENREGREMIFSLAEKKVVSLKVTSFYDDEE